jgi:hypothetical protein
MGGSEVRSQHLKGRPIFSTGHSPRAAFPAGAVTGTVTFAILARSACLRLRTRVT